MVLHICEKCGKEFNRKSNFQYHISKKIPCKKNVTISDINIKQIQNNPNKSKIIQNNSKNLKSETECTFCLKIFSSVCNLNKHMNNSCKIKKQKENNKEEIFKKLLEENNKQFNKQLNEQKEFMKKMSEENKHLRAEVDKLKSNKNTVKNNHSNNTTNSHNTTNIVMMDFGKENLQIIDKSEFIKIVKNNKITGVKITDELLKAIHFNDKYPQLNNIYISDINRQKCMIVENNEWKLSPVDQIPQVIENIVKYSHEKNEELSEKYKDNKVITNRLKVINKYTKLSDPEYLEELIDEEAPPRDIKRCKDFQQHTYDTVKTTLYNKGKKNKKSIK